MVDGLQLSANFYVTFLQIGMIADSHKRTVKSFCSNSNIHQSQS